MINLNLLILDLPLFIICLEKKIIKMQSFCKMTQIVFYKMTQIIFYKMTQIVFYKMTKIVFIK